MLTIYKYPFPVEDNFRLSLPRGAKILAAECQGRTPCLWAMASVEAPIEDVGFRICGTGYPIRPEEAAGMEHISTFQQGPFVWHLFRVRDDRP